MFEHIAPRGTWSPDYVLAQPCARGALAQDTPSDVWEGASAAYPWPEGPLDLDVLSTSQDDAQGGPGAQVVEVVALDEALAPRTYRVALNGTTPVPLPGTFAHAQSLRVTRTGASSGSAGDVAVVDRATSEVLRLAPAGTVRDRSGVLMLPAGMRASPLLWSAGLLDPGNNDRVVLTFEAAYPGEPWDVVQLREVTKEHPWISESIPTSPVSTTGTRWRLRALSDRNGAEVRGSLTLILDTGARAIAPVVEVP